MNEVTKALIIDYTAGAHDRIKSKSKIGEQISNIYKLVGNKYELFTNEELIGMFLGLNCAITIVQATKTNLPEDGGILSNIKDANFAWRNLGLC